jgi:hypothetical protein
MSEPKGGPILRHTAAPAATDVAHADDERLTAHLTRTIGKPTNVFHELVSDRVHVDLHVVPLGNDRPFTVVVTSGMSARPMTVTGIDKPEAWRHAELCILLPPDWKLDQESFADERWYWPLRLLKKLARLPHDYATWLGWGHSIPNGDPARPYVPSTTLAGAVLIPPLLLDGLFEVPGDPPMHIFQVLPLTAAEIALKMEHGVDALLEGMEEELGDDAFGPIDPQRPSVA